MKIAQHIALCIAVIGIFATSQSSNVSVDDPTVNFSMNFESVEKTENPILGDQMFWNNQSKVNNPELNPSTF